MPGKVVFVTGAATGIGRETCKILHKNGWRLALFDVNKDQLESLKKELGSGVIIFKGSVTELLQLEEAMAQTKAEFGRIDAVFANAGVVHPNPVVTMEEAEWLRVIDINLNGVWRTVKAATEYLLESKGYVLITSSITSSIALPSASHYVATKAGVLNFAEAYRSEMYGFGVEVGTIHPTFIRTPMIDNAIYEDEVGKIVQSTSKILFFEFPLKWAASTAAGMIMHRRRRATVPDYTHLPFIWFPRLATSFANVWAFRRNVMRRVIEQARAIRAQEK